MGLPSATPRWILAASLATLLFPACHPTPKSDVLHLDGEPRPGPAVHPERQKAGKHSWVEIDGAAFDHNLRLLRQRVVKPGTRICAVMKADAYGHGMENLVPIVIKNNIDCIGFVSNAEAQIARRLGFQKTLTRIRTATLEEVADGLALGVEELTGSLEHLRGISALGERNRRVIPVHLAINAGGMSRNGLEVETDEGKREALEMLRLPNITVVGIMTHFPVEESGDINNGLKKFNEQSAWLIAHGGLDRSKLTLHCANSAATVFVPESQLDMVRVGGIMYGFPPAPNPDFKPVLRVKSRVASIMTFRAGNTVGYDRTFRLTRNSRLANIPLGYSDGYLRAFSNQASVIIQGRRFPVVGRISMNTMMVDVTDGPEIRPGQEVLAAGREGSQEIPFLELGDMAGTTPGELLTLIGNSNPKYLVN